MRFEILGPLAIWRGDSRLSPRGARQQALLAVLLAAAPEAVPVNRLIRVIWTDAESATVAALRMTVSRLRRWGEEHGWDCGIERAGEAYRLSLGTGTLDAVGFRAGLTAVHDLPSSSVVERRDMTLRVLSRCRGPVLADLPASVRTDPAVVDLARSHAAAVHHLTGHCLATGQPELVLPHLDLVRQDRLDDERLAADLAMALAAAGRQAQGLAVLDELTRRLADELGVDPGPMIDAARLQILRAGHGPATRPESPGRATDGAAASAPVRSLPRTVDDFTGRAGVVAAFRARLARAGPGPIVQVIDGMAGVGKTTLAVHLAGLSADRYPDGHLFIDLHGHSAHDMVDPSTALITLLRQLDVAPERIPAAIEQRVALWRSEVARRRCILVLDNAPATAQVLPLLPGSGDNLTLVTSRRRLSGLDGVQPESLPVLHSDEGADLFRRIVGDRARTEPEAVAEVVRRCGYLPLAIRLAAARLSSRPSWQVADLVTRLGDATLAQLVAEDRTVAAAFALSYAQLPAESQRVFRLLGIHPAEGFDAASAAALADLPLDEADRILESLVDVHLVEATGRGAYRLHDLIRQYAGLLAADPEETRAAAYRLFDHTMHSAAVVSAPLELPTTLLNRRFAEPWRVDLLPDPGADPIRWFDGRRHAHLAIVRLAGHLGADSYVWLLARSAWRLWYLRAEYDELIDAHRRGLAAARSAGDDYATAMMLNYLASGLYRVGRLPEAVEMTAAASEAFARLGDSRSAVLALANLGLLRVAYGDLEGAVQAAGHTLDWAARRGFAAMSEPSLTIMGEVERRRGNLEASLRWFRHHMLSAIRSSGTVTRYLALNNVAVARMRLGHPAAERLLRLSIALNGRIGARSVLAESTTALAVLERREGRLDDAIRRHRSAVELAGTNRDVRLRAAVRNDYAETLQVAGDRTAAAALFREAAGLAQAAGALWEQIRSLDGLATVLDDPEAAAGHREQAAALLRNSPAGPTLLRPLDDRS